MLGKMRIKLFILIELLYSISLFSQGNIEYRKIGKVNYYVPISNNSLVMRNDSIALEINEYIIRHASKLFPEILLYISDQSPNNFEEVRVYYQKYSGEFFHKEDFFNNYKKEHIGLDLFLKRNHSEVAIKAIKSAVDNFRKLKKLEKKLSKKQLKAELSEEDLTVFLLQGVP
jgi:hypothetical protein